MLLSLLKNRKLSVFVEKIAEKIENQQRITDEEALLLFENVDLSVLGIMADFANQRINGNRVYYNRNFHIEPTNICIYNCAFCSYVRKEDENGWELTPEQILKIVDEKVKIGATEVHIVSGVHPDRDLHYYGNIIKRIKQHYPTLHIKAFTAVELHFMIKKAGLNYEEGLMALKEYGLDSIPGGGAEIFDKEVRKTICPHKPSAEIWLRVHETAHRLGIMSNASILYGHVENYKHRISHLALIRELQDKTGGINAFIPLKFKRYNNKLSYINEISDIEVLKNFAVTRLYLDNIPHLKAYWVMLGKDLAQTALAYGVDDMDGTINDTTQIYSRAGADDQAPSLTTDQLIRLISDMNRVAIERDSLYNPID